MELSDFIDPAELQRILNEHPEPDRATDTFLQRLMAEKPEQFIAWLDYLKESNPEAHAHLVKSLNMPSATLELAGYETWLRTLGPQTFERDFAPIQHRFWEWNWRTLRKRKQGLPLEPTEKVGFVPWSRETGKSSSIEWAAIAEGAILVRGFVIYLTGKQLQAEKHVIDIRDRIESEDIGKYYPHLSKPKFGAHGNKYGWGKEFLLTRGGWAIQPIGLDVAIRGGKIGNFRPTLIVIDDIDDLGESIAVILTNEQKLTRSILAMGDANTRVLVAQNPIHSMSVINRLLTGVCSALAVRTVFGGGPDGREPVKAVENLEVDHVQVDGGPRHLIRSGTSNWPGITLDMWQDSLDRVGYEGFMAEYQHDFSAEMEERVLPEYDDRVLRLHVITWEQFARKYHLDRIPMGWPCDLGLDLGFSREHKSAWTFTTKAPLGCPLAGSVFRYRGRTFVGVSVDDQSDSVREDMWAGERPTRQYMSHEKLGERITLNSKHKWRFRPCDSDKNAGWAQWRHLLRPDRRQPHPFHADEKDPVSGLWRLGRPSWFDIVVDEKQWQSPVDDLGLKYHRDSAYTQRKKKVHLTESGLSAEQPMKKDDDPNDSTRMLLTTASFGPSQKPLTVEQKVEMAIPAGSHIIEIMTRPDLDATQKALSADYVRLMTKKMVEAQKPTERDVYGQPIGKWRSRY